MELDSSDGTRVPGRPLIAQIVVSAVLILVLSITDASGAALAALIAVLVTVGVLGAAAWPRVATSSGGSTGPVIRWRTHTRALPAQRRNRPPPRHGWSMLRPAPDCVTPGPIHPVLIRGGQLYVVLELTRGADASSTPGNLHDALVPLAAAGGITVDANLLLPAAVDATGATNAARRAVFVLRLDPESNRRAIDARGGGSVGATRVVTVTIARATALLAPHGVRPRVLEPVTAVRVLTAARAEAQPP